MSNSLDELIDLDVGLAIVCNDCHHYSEINIQSGVKKFGGAVRLRQLKPRLRCTACNAGNCGFQLRNRHMLEFPQTKPG